MSDDVTRDDESSSPGGGAENRVAATIPMAAARPAESQARGTPLAAQEAMVELNALLGQGTHYAGKLWFEGRVRVEGRFEGEIRGEVLIVGAGAELEGEIEVDVCIVTGGRVRGDIRARNAIELHAPAVVVGDLHAPNVFIDRGVQFEGSCKMAPLEDDDNGPSEPHADAQTATDPDDEPPPPADEEQDPPASDRGE